MGEIFVPKLKRLRVWSEGKKVILLIEGKRVEMPYEIALNLSNALRMKGKECEEIDKAQDLIMDSAILKRVGVPIGLSNNLDIHKEAEKEALHNRDLRRFIEPRRAKGIGSKERFGTPTIRKENPK